MEVGVRGKGSVNEGEIGDVKSGAGADKGSRSKGSRVNLSVWVGRGCNWRGWEQLQRQN